MHICTPGVPSSSVQLMTGLQPFNTPVGLDDGDVDGELDGLGLGNAEGTMVVGARVGQTPQNPLGNKLWILEGETHTVV